MRLIAMTCLHDYFSQILSQQAKPGDLSDHELTLQCGGDPCLHLLQRRAVHHETPEGAVRRD